MKSKTLKRVLFVCVHNSGRSQMAEAFTKALSGGEVEAESAGTLPSEGVNAVAIVAMREKSIDISRNRPKVLTQEMVDRADKVFTMGCSIVEVCPAVFVPSEDWGLDDPAGQPIDVVRRIRDQIEERVRQMPADLNGER